MSSRSETPRFTPKSVTSPGILHTHKRDEARLRGLAPPEYHHPTLIPLSSSTHSLPPTSLDD